MYHIQYNTCKHSTTLLTSDAVSGQVILTTLYVLDRTLLLRTLFQNNKYTKLKGFTVFNQLYESSVLTLCWCPTFCTF